MEWYLEVLKKYAEFNGRARRKEYWMFFLFNVIISFAIGFICGLIQGFLNINLDFVSLIYSLAVFIPGVAVAIRRMHDIDRSGWWLLVPILNLVYVCKKGTDGVNRFGEDPLEVAVAA